ncbi:MAG: hypothetical protein U0838_14035 [Chloroflexota bacterium]
MSAPASSPTPSGATGATAMEITPRDRFWMNFKLFQLFRFVVLNLKILKGVNQAKRS